MPPSCTTGFQSSGEMGVKAIHGYAVTCCHKYCAGENGLCDRDAGGVIGGLSEIVTLGSDPQAFSGLRDQGGGESPEINLESSRNPKIKEMAGGRAGGIGEMKTS